MSHGTLSIVVRIAGQVLGLALGWMLTQTCCFLSAISVTTTPSLYYITIKVSVLFKIVQKATTPVSYLTNEILITSLSQLYKAYHRGPRKSVCNDRGIWLFYADIIMHGHYQVIKTCVSFHALSPLKIPSYLAVVVILDVRQLNLLRKKVLSHRNGINLYMIIYGRQA